VKEHAPWYIVYMGDGGFEIRESEDNLNARHDPYIASCGSEETARLIAAAPQLLSACRVALKHVEQSGGHFIHNALCTQLRVAVRLAKRGR
jgi:hypothetical protein